MDSSTAKMVLLPKQAISIWKRKINLKFNQFKRQKKKIIKCKYKHIKYVNVILKIIFKKSNSKFYLKIEGAYKFGTS